MGVDHSFYNISNTKRASNSGAPESNVSVRDDIYTKEKKRVCMVNQSLVHVLYMLMDLKLVYFNFNKISKAGFRSS